MATVHATSCPLDCPDTCALDVTVEEGRVAKIAAGNGHPANSGFICSKLARFDRRLYHPDRLLYPMRRVGAKGEGRFERISWGEAIATITGRFKQIVEEWGGEAVLPYNYGGSSGMLTDGFIVTVADRDRRRLDVLERESGFVSRRSIWPMPSASVRPLPEPTSSSAPFPDTWGSRR